MSNRKKVFLIIGLVMTLYIHEMAFEEEQSTKGVINYEYSNR